MLGARGEKSEHVAANSLRSLSYACSSQQPRVHRRIAGDDDVCATGAGAPVEVGHDAARLADEQDARRRCPTARASTPRTPRSGRRRRRRGRAPPRRRGGCRRRRAHDAAKRAQILVDLVAVLERKAGADRARARGSSIFETRIGCPLRRAPPPRVAVNSSPVGDVEHDAGRELAVDERGDRHGVPRKAVQEVRRAVERIGDEHETARRRRAIGESSSPRMRASAMARATTSPIAARRRDRRRSRNRRAPSSSHVERLAALGAVRARSPRRAPRRRRRSRAARAIRAIAASRESYCLRRSTRSYVRGCHGSSAESSRRASCTSATTSARSRTGCSCSTSTKSIFCIVDYHAITGAYDPQQLRERRREMAVVAARRGHRSERSPRCSCSRRCRNIPSSRGSSTPITPLGELERQTQFKEKSQRQESVTAGLLNYPVLQAADILLYRADIGAGRRRSGAAPRAVARGRAPVERARSRRPERRSVSFSPSRSRVLTPTRRIMGLDGQAKMSKSMGNTIGLLESPEDDLGEAASGGDRSQAHQARPIPGRPRCATSITCTRRSARPPRWSTSRCNAARRAGDASTARRCCAESMEQELVPIRAARGGVAGEPRGRRRRAGRGRGALPGARARDDAMACASGWASTNRAGGHVSCILQ